MRCIIHRLIFLQDLTERRGNSRKITSRDTEGSALEVWPGVFPPLRVAQRARTFPARPA